MNEIIDKIDSYDTKSDLLWNNSPKNDCIYRSFGTDSFIRLNMSL